jgi:alpha-tubulin suppressor-like RCC1 family protein
MTTTSLTPVLAVLCLFLAACGGGHGDPPAPPAQGAAAATAPDRRALSTTAAPASIDNLLDWAQWRYPSLFPAGPTSTQAVYLGVPYTLRSYANGNHLGVTPQGEVFGLGPFTLNQLLPFGRIGDYQAGLQQDLCGYRPSACTAPTFSTPPLNTSADLGQTVAFTVTVSGTPTPTLQWRRNGVAIPGAVGTSHSFGPVAAADDGAVFTVLASNGAGSVVSAAAVLRVTTPLAQAAAPRVAAGGRAGLGHSTVRTASGQLWAWGANQRGQVGDGTRTQRNQPVLWANTGAGRVITAFSLGAESTLALSQAGQGFWAGAGSNGQDGTGSFGGTLSPGTVTVLSSLSAVAVGDGYTVAALADGRLWAWGNVPTGVRSQTAVRLAGFEQITSVCVAEESIVALRRDGTVWFAGTDRGGGMPGTGSEFTAVVTSARQVPGLERITQIACGLGSPTAYALALRSDGQVFSWGDATGLGVPISGFVRFSVAAIPGLSQVSWIAASNTGLAAAFAVTRDGRVLAWGFDRSGALALGAMSPFQQVVTPQLSSLITDVAEVSTSGEHTLFLKRDGSVWAVGSNATGQLGHPPSLAAGLSLTPVLVEGLILN